MRDDYLTAVGGRNAATSGIYGATLCVLNYCPYIQLDTELSVGMAPESPQAPPPFFDRRRIGNAISIDVVGSPGRIRDLDCRFEEYWHGCDSRVRDM